MKEDNYKRPIFFSIIFISLGVVFLNSQNNSQGIIFIAIGGLFFIAGMKKKREEEKDKK